MNRESQRGTTVISGGNFTSLRSVVWAALLTALLAGLCCAQTPATITLTFEGLQDEEPILNYYAGGLGGFGSGPGPNYGITFGSDALAGISSAAGGTGNFSGNPSGNTTAFFLNGSGLVMNVAAGFTTGFSFWYASGPNTGVVTVYSGLNATGTLLATINLPANGTNCNGSSYTFSCWTALGGSFAGVAKSVNFGGADNGIGFDNITVGSQIATNLLITTSALPNGTVNLPYASTTLQATGGKTPYTWSATGLPAGLGVNSTTGVLSGTPTQSGTFSVTVTVKDSTPEVPLTASQTYSLTIVAGLTITTTSLPSGIINVTYPSTTLQASGGKTPYTWSATGLPAGLSVNSTTSVLSGTPTQSGTFSVTVTVKDSTSEVPLTASQTYSLTIVAGLTITTISLPGGTINVAYPSTTLQASGGKAPYTWSATGLPSGLSLSSVGVLSGTPTQSGTFSVTATVKDSTSEVPPTASQSYSLTIVAGLTIATTSLPSGAVNVAYPSTTLQASGGNTPYTWSQTGLPAGLSLNSAGVLSGKPTQPGTFSVVVTIKDSSSPALTASQTYSLTIVAGLTITTTSLPSGTVNVAYPSTTLQASGGNSPYAWSQTGLPAGLSLSSAGVLSGTPTQSSSFSVAVTVKDSSSPALTASATYTLTVTIQPVQGIAITQSSGGAPNQTNLLVSFGQAAQSTYTGTLSLSFQHDPSVTNVPANYVDPAGGFPVSGSSTNLTQNFTVNQGTTQASVQFGLGTVAGTWTVTLTALNTGGASALPSPAPTYTVSVATAAPSITAGSVRIVSLSSSGFSVTLTGFATTRDVASGMFTFAAAAGAQLQGATVTVPFNGLDQSEWFNTAAGQSAGGTFSLTLPFGYSGDPSALGSVTVTLTNSRGQMSAAVSGGT